MKNTKTKTKKKTDTNSFHSVKPMNSNNFKVISLIMKPKDLSSLIELKIINKKRGFFQNFFGYPQKKEIQFCFFYDIENIEFFEKIKRDNKCFKDHLLKIKETEKGFIVETLKLNEITHVEMDTFNYESSDAMKFRFSIEAEDLNA